MWLQFGSVQDVRDALTCSRDRTLLMSSDLCQFGEVRPQCGWWVVSVGVPGFFLTKGLRGNGACPDGLEDWKYVRFFFFFAGVSEIFLWIFYSYTFSSLAAL